MAEFISKNPAYQNWIDMKHRTTNKYHAKYPKYGGVGIGLDPDWLRFENFLADMGEKPGKGYTIERRDNSLGYCKSNCRWATKAEQNANKNVQARSKTGIAGVTLRPGGRFVVAGNRTNHLYWGNDFFEACCRRKSWELQKENFK